MHAVGAIRLARDDAAQKDHIFTAAAVVYSHIVIDDMRQPLGQVGQLVIVGGEERLSAQPGMVVDILDHRPGDRQPVVSARAAPDLVEQQQAATGGVVENVGSLDHLHHEGGLAAMNLVAGAQPGEDAIHHADARPIRRHKAADLRQ